MTTTGTTYIDVDETTILKNKGRLNVVILPVLSTPTTSGAPSEDIDSSRDLFEKVFPSIAV